MAAFRSQLLEGIAGAFEFLKSTKEAYEGAGRFAKMRIWILSVLIADVVATLMFVALVGGREIDVEVWFEQSFPSNMLIVRNESGDELEDVRLTLDRRYVLQVSSIAPGLRGFEVNREFRDSSGAAPDDAYRPQQLEIRAGRDVMMVPVSGRPGR
jgi:hypothetical protein